MKLFLAFASGSAAAIVATASPCLQQSTSVSWEFAGPSTYVGRGDEPQLSSAGAVQNVVEGANHTWFIGSVNGGVWRTKSLGHSTPHWENVLDKQPVTCSSISAMHVSVSDANRIYAGCGGSTSSEQGSDWNVMNSGDWAGIMMSSDNGDSWRMLEAFPSNYYVTDIMEPSPDSILVSAQSHLYDRNDGGIWLSEDRGHSFKRIDSTPTFTLTALPGAAADSDVTPILATHARNAEHSVSLSEDGGKTFSDYGRLPWAEGATPFYTCAAPLGNGQLVVAGLTRGHGGLPNNTDSQFFVRNVSSGSSNEEWVSFDQPTSMDEDSMPKDRMAIMGDPDPERADMFYIAGNAGALAWRANVTDGKWTQMWDKPDVSDGSIPHGDCRNYAWDAAEERLLLVSDGGIFGRESPRESGGKWVSLNGDYASMELLSAHYDWRDDRYIAGAQDNCAQVTPINSTSSDVAVGFVEGDGTVTLVDSNANPSRLFGTTQFLGVGTIDIDPSIDVSSTVGDDDDGCGGLCFTQGDKFINVPIDKYFPEPSTFPFFVQPYALNRQDPTRLQFWTNGTTERPSAFYEFSIPYTVKDKDDIPPPTKIVETPEDSFFLDFISGGTVPGGAEEDPSLIIGMSNSHLYVRSNLTNDGDFVSHELPAHFATPVTLLYDDAQKGARILGPVTHGRTASLTVSPSDSSVIAVTGWPDVSSNEGDEVVFLTFDGGHTWTNATGNLREAAGVVGKARPGGVLIVDVDADGVSAQNGTSRVLLVGTSSGVLAASISESLESEPKWQRLGTCDEFPIVLTADLDYEPHSDRLIAATFGRGIYSLKNARETLRQLTL